VRVFFVEERVEEIGRKDGRKKGGEGENEERDIGNAIFRYLQAPSQHVNCIFEVRR